MSDKPKPVRHLLGGTALACIRAELEQQGRLLLAVREGLPDFLGARCRYCIARNERLMIYVDSPAWGSQLRFYGPSLLARLEQLTGCRFKDIQIRNLLPVSAAVAGPTKPRLLSPPARGLGEILRQNAESSPQEIKEALLKLSRAIESVRGAES